MLRDVDRCFRGRDRKATAEEKGKERGGFHVRIIAAELTRRNRVEVMLLELPHLRALFELFGN